MNNFTSQNKTRDVTRKAMYPIVFSVTSIKLFRLMRYGVGKYSLTVPVFIS